MSISPAQTNLQVGTTEGSSSAGHSSQPATPGVAEPASSHAKFPSENPVPVPIISPAPLSTDMRIDDQRQIYYRVVNERTGDVLLEIPCEALREIGESIKVQLEGDASIHGVDVKS
jgi:hypothetical protein